MHIDLTFGLEFIPSSVELLDSYAIVIGSKKIGKQKRVMWKKILSFAYIFLAESLFGLGVTDYSLGGNAYRKSIILSRVKKMDGGSFYFTDFIYHAKKKG